MAKKKETKQIPAVIDGLTREDITEAIGKFKADNPDAQVGVIQYDGSRENPFWIEIEKA